MVPLARRYGVSPVAQALRAKWPSREFIVAADLYDEFLDKFTKKVLETADGLAPLSSLPAAQRLA